MKNPPVSLVPTSVTIKVHPDHCKSFPDPNGKGRKRIIAQVPVDEIAKADINFGPNPRNQSLETKVSQAIAEGLISHPGWFLYFNRGIVLNAESAEYNNQTHELTLGFSRNPKSPWESPFGNLDGGHTNRLIIRQLKERKWINSPAASERQYVTLEILIGIEEGKVSDLVGARNTNYPVKDLSLLVLDKGIDWLREITRKKGVDDKIAWRQFDEGKVIMGEDVIATLSLLNDSLEVKNKCYNGPGRIISELKTNSALMDGLQKTSDIAFEFLKFVDYIHASFEYWYNEVELKGKKKKSESGFGRLLGVSGAETKDWHQLVFLGEKIRYKLLKSWLLPLAFSFTRVVKKEREDIDLWYKIADQVGPRLYATLREQTANVANNLDKIGKSSAVWNALEAIVWAEYATHKLELTKV